MAPSSEIQNRIERLREELVKTIAHANLRARANYWISLLLMLIILASSATAGIGGFFFNLNREIVSGLALLPGIMALVAVTLKSDCKANWYYRKKDELNELRRRLLYELPETPTADNIAAISHSWNELTKEMSQEWEKEFTFNWTKFSKPPNSKST